MERKRCYFWIQALPLYLQQGQSHLISQILYITFRHRSQTWFPRSIRFRKDARIFFFLLNFMLSTKEAIWTQMTHFFPYQVPIFNFSNHTFIIILSFPGECLVGPFKPPDQNWGIQSPCLASLWDHLRFWRFWSTSHLLYVLWLFGFQIQDFLQISCDPRCARCLNVIPCVPDV